MNVAIVGSSGYIGNYLIYQLQCRDEIKKIIRIDQTQDADYQLNLMQPENFEYNVLEEIDYIIFTAAISGPDKCASEYDFCFRINVTGTIYFIRKAIQQKCKIIFFSSDAVFGDDVGIFNELSETKAVTPYGRMKKAVEDEFISNPFFKAIRLSYVVSINDRFVSYCLKCIANQEVAEIFHPFYRNCITISDVKEAIFWLLFHWDKYEPIFLNVVGKELISRIRIADEINRYINGKLRYKIVVPSMDFFTNRPKITQTESLYLFERKILKDVSFSEKIKKELERGNL